jgi:alkanesulfonate monooxygenase SsuD/methylene tetrahydromethanopterin reductase-like flavin-dependent oxidoreductase (luciferase family)
LIERKAAVALRSLSAGITSWANRRASSREKVSMSSRRAVPATDGEFHVDRGATRKNRPALAISGTPDQIVDTLQQTLDVTGARRLLIETFSREEARLFAHEVIPVLRERNATTASRSINHSSREGDDADCDHQ